MTDALAPPQESEQVIPATPFVGLVPYGEGDAAFFFGRDEEKAIITANLRASRLTILYGASGVGKTSVLHAGVVHDLHEQVREIAAGRSERSPFAICAFSSWRDDPLSALAETMRAACSEALGGEELPPWLPGDPLLEAVRGWTERVRPLLVVLDQFEEYFLYHAAEDGEGTFAAEFPGLVNEPNLRVNFILSLREDAWAKLDRFEDSIPALFDNYVRVDHLDRKAAREAIDGPVREWNRLQPPGEEPYEVEPALAEKVIEAAAAGRLALTETGNGGGPDAAAAGGVEAPFLQLVLERLWRATIEAGAHTLDLARLEALGGAQQIVENHLLEALGKLTPGEQAAAADLFRYLVTRSKTKIAHPATDLAEWTGRPEPEVTAVLEKLCRGESGRILRSVSPPAGETAVSYELFHDVLAEPILEWRRGYEQERARRLALRRFARIGGGLLALVAIFGGLGIWALLQRSDARDATASATSLALASAADNQLAGHPEVSLLLGLEAYRANPSAQARSTMTAALEAARRSGSEVTLYGHTVPVGGVAFSPDGRVLATADEDGTVRLWDGRTHEQLGEPLRGDRHQVSSVAFSPDGKTLMAGSQNGTVRLWDVRTHQALDRPFHAAVEDSPNPRDNVVVAFGSDGRPLAATSGLSVERLWDVRSHTQLGQPVREDPDTALELTSVAFSPDGNVLATADFLGTVRLWDVRAKKQITRWSAGPEGSISSMALSPDRRTLATGNIYGTVRLWDVATGTLIGQPLRGHARAVESVAFSPAGRRLATGSADKTVRLWDVRTHRPLGEPLRGHTGAVLRVAFSPEGRTIASVGADRTARLWDAHTRRRLGDRLRGDVGRGMGVVGGAISEVANVVAFSPDGRTLAAASADNAVRLWDARTHAQLGPPLSSGTRPPAAGCKKVRRGKKVVTECALGLAVVAFPPGATSPVAVAFDPDGRKVAAAGANARVRLWDERSHRQLGRPLRTGADLSSVAFSPDGRIVATSGFDTGVALWDARSGRRLGRLRRPGTVYGVAFSPDSGTLATAGADGIVRLWDIRTREQIEPPLRGHTSSVSSVAFSPDGRTVASTGTDSTVRLWDVSAHRALGQPISGLAAWRAAFSPDGRTLATAGDDGTVRLWDVGSHAQLGPPLRGHDGAVWSVAFSPDGRTLASSGADGAVRLWEGIHWRDSDDLTAQVCDIVSGDLSPAEWAVLAPGIAYRTTCPD